MYIDPLLSDFLNDCRQIQDEFQLRALLAEITASLGFEQFALVHHVDLAGPPSGAMILMSYNEGWIERAISKRYFVDDPIHAASTRTVTGFLWRDVPRMLSLSNRQERILDEARAFGLCEGLTVPVHSPGEYRGTCSFGTRALTDLSTNLLGAAQLVATFAFEAARRLLRDRWRQPGDLPVVPTLSPRQLDCVALVACGRGDGEIAHILGLSEPTVHQHINEAMRRYGVSKRTQLVVRALFDGQICYRESVR
jgi:LuxR family quorum-sensing system transcriptional regulator CciR